MNHNIFFRTTDILYEMLDVYWGREHECWYLAITKISMKLIFFCIQLTN